MNVMPIAITEITNYVFSTAAKPAYGDHMIGVAPAVLAFYSGDINQDENIDLLDAPIVETNINQFVFSGHP